MTDMVAAGVWWDRERADRLWALMPAGPAARGDRGLGGGAARTRQAPGRPRPRLRRGDAPRDRSEEHTSELQSQSNLVCRLLLEKKKTSHVRVDHPMLGPSSVTHHRCDLP